MSSSPAVDLTDVLEGLAFGLVALTSRAIQEATHARELTFQQWRVLVVLGGAPTGMRVTDLARRIAASGPSTSRLARRMAGHGLLVAANDPADRRAIRLSLSSEGEALRARIVARRRALIDETVTGYTPSASVRRELASLAGDFERWT